MPRSELIQQLQHSGYAARAEYEWSQFEKSYQLEVGASLPDNAATLAVSSLFGRSFYLTNRLLLNPQLATPLIQPDALSQAKSIMQFSSELEQRMQEVADQKQALRVLREYRYEETIRITVRELMVLDDYDSLGRERSALAQACVSAAVTYLARTMSSQWGQPVNSAGQPMGFTVLGMGKLGGEDLNYSSDIDLIYFYGADGNNFLNGDAHGKSFHEYFVSYGKTLTYLLNERTADGFVYRVDMDLRPEGTQGTLANSLEAMETYYESFGDNWERMAMTKARPVGGDISLGERFLKTMSPFVYPRVKDYSTIDQVLDLKKRIEQSLQGKHSTGIDPQQANYNVKLGIGGIREVEFFIGAFQRLYGGEIPELRTRHSMSALEQIKNFELIPEAEYNALAQAYRFLRTVENRLQTYEEQQTHSLPRAKEDLQALAINLYPKSESIQAAVDQLQDQLLIHTECVRRSFAGLLERSDVA